jgi:probable rRNA maturation factor
MEICVTRGSGEPWLLPMCAAELARALEAMAGGMQAQNQAGRPEYLELVLLDDSGMAELNLSFLGLGGPTNVLAFPGGSTGSLALDVQTVCREAWLYGQEARRYTLKMLAHGLAQIMGYEHGPEMDKEVERAAAVAEAVLA